VDVRAPRVAVIDDDEEFASLMEALLEEEGYAFARLDIGRADPAEVVAAAEPDVVVLDLRGVYDGGGLALLARLRAHQALADLPVLVCSADIHLLRAHAAELAGMPAVAALEKPFRIEALMGALERLLAGSMHPPAVGTPDPEASSALGELLARMGDTLRWPALDAWVPDARPGMLRCAAAWVASARLNAFAQVSRRTLLPFGGGLPGRIWVSARPAWVEDLGADMNFPRLPTAHRSGLVSAAGAPVTEREQIVGVVAAYDQRLRRRDDAALDRLSEAAREAGPLLRAAAGLAAPSASSAASAPA
jgi:CheY-like chemotaxis protein